MTIEELVSKILSDSRVHAAVAQVLSDMLSNVSAPAPEKEKDVSETKTAAATAKRREYKIDWTKLTAQSTYKLYYRRINHNREIEPELDEALRRFYPDSYNPETKRITKKAHKKDYFNATKESVYQVYFYRVNHNQEIEPELDEALRRLYPDSYNPETKRIIRKEQAHKTDYSNATKKSVYQVYYQRINHNQEIEPELDEALRRLYPDSYNPETKRITKKALAHKTDYSNATKKSVYQVYSYRVKHNQEIEPELDKALRRFYPDSYNPKTQLIDKERRTRKTSKNKETATRRIVEPKSKRKKSYMDCSSAYLKILYNSYSNKDDIPEDLHQALIAKIPGYVAKTREMVRPHRGKRYATVSAIAELYGTKPKSKPQPAVEPVVHIATAEEIATLEQDANSLFSGGASSTVTATPPAPAKPSYVENVSYPTIELQVTVKPIKTTLDGTFSDVFVNGRRILHNHLNTELHTFADATFLGIYGIVTTDKELPPRPLWMLFKTNLEQTKATQTDKRYKGRRIYVKAIYENGNNNELRVDYSDNSITLFNIERAKRQAQGHIFKTINERTK